MIWRRVSLLAPILVAALWFSIDAQQSASILTIDDTPVKPPKAQFFAGLVIEADADHLKVSRTLVGRPPETHVFAIDGKTKTPKGGVKVKTRVTVRYQHLPERDLALEIQVRPSNHAQKTS